jgi:hypothetical protein
MGNLLAVRSLAKGLVLVTRHAQNSLMAIGAYRPQRAST